jgi:hypothetical protein
MSNCATQDHKIPTVVKGETIFSKWNGGANTSEILSNARQFLDRRIAEGKKNNK